MSGPMSRLMLTAAVSLLSVAFAVGPTRALEIFFDEDGSGFGGGADCTAVPPGADPTHLVPAGTKVLIYKLPQLVQTGDVSIKDPSGALSDALRFFSDANPGGTGLVA